MRTSEFTRLCDELCALLGAGTAVPEQRQAGLWRVRLHHKEMDFHLLHAPGVDGDTACVVLEAGVLPEAAELRGWLDLLEANHRFRGASAPRFCRDAETGEVTLQWAFGLGDTDAAGLRAKLLAMIQLVGEHRELDMKRRP